MSFRIQNTTLDEALSRVAGMGDGGWTAVAATTARAPTTAITTRVADAPTPIYKRWWFWALVAGGGYMAWRKFGKRKGKRSPLAIAG